MGNKLRFSDNGIEIIVDRGDEESLQKICKIYPIHSNRIKTKFITSICNTPEVLDVMRDIKIEDLERRGVPDTIKHYFYREMRAREGVESILQGRTALDPKVSDTLTLMPHQPQRKYFLNFCCQAV